MDEFDKDLVIKKSAELLRAGARMLPSQCPSCGSPLFKLRTGEVVCPVHGRVVIVRKEEEAVQASMDAVLTRLEEKAVARLSLLLSHVDDLEETPSHSERLLLRVIRGWLEVVSEARRIRSMSEKREEG